MPFVSEAEPRPLLAGRYEIVALVGAGAMGRVYRVVDRELDETVALKVLAHHLLEQAGMVERFRREVKLARRVTHENVARVFDIGEHGAERFLTMEFVEGESLGDVIARRGPLPAAQVVAMGRAVCAGLAAAHAAGVVHRDLKPDNVLVARSGRVAITDFGIASSLAQPLSNQTAGHLIGTPAYMAPEQVEGSKAGPAADIYALGATLFELCTGERPFKGSNPLATAMARLTTSPPDPRTLRAEVPASLAEVLLRSMARAPQDRFASALVLDAALGEIEAELGAIGSGSGRAAAPSAPRRERGGASTLATGRDSSRDVLARRIVVSSAPRPGDADVTGDAATALAVAPRLASPGRHDRTLAVLPFRNTGPADDAYLADGLTEQVIDELSMTRGVRVRSPGGVARFKGSTRDPRDIGGELDVQVIAEGTLRREGDHVRIAVRLIGVGDGFQLWASRLERKASDLLVVADEIAQSIADHLLASRAPGRGIPTNTLAVDLYLRARAASRQAMTVAAADEALRLYDEALGAAPADPAIVSGNAMMRARYWLVTGRQRDEAIAATARAIAVAPEVAEARLALAYAYLQDANRAGAVREAKRAIVLSPGLPEAHYLLGRILTEAGLATEGLRRLEAAVQIDPGIDIAYPDLALGHALEGSWDEARAVVEQQIERGLYRGWLVYARLALWSRDQRAARAGLERIGDGTDPLIRLARASLQHILDPNAPFAALDRFFVGEFVPFGTPRSGAFPAQLRADVAAFLRQNDLALASIEDAVTLGLGDLHWLERCPLLEPLRQHPKFEVLRQVMRERAARVTEAFLTSA